MQGDPHATGGKPPRGHLRSARDSGEQQSGDGDGDERARTDLEGEEEEEGGCEEVTERLDQRAGALLNGAGEGESDEERPDGGGDL